MIVCRRSWEVNMPFDGALPRPTHADADLVFGKRTLGPLAIPPRPAMRRSKADREAIAVLSRARELILEEGHWCRGMYARAWFFLPVRPEFKAARRYCALGAIMRAAHELHLPTGRASAALKRQTGSLIPNWNDSPRRTHTEVLAAFDAALSHFRAV
jgi:hypothetical protein